MNQMPSHPGPQPSGQSPQRPGDPRWGGWGPQGYGQPGDPSLALSDLPSRPRYRSEGLAMPSVLGWLVLDMGLMAILAALAGFLIRGNPVPIVGDFFTTLAAFMLFCLGSLFTLHIVGRCRVQQWWIVGAMNLVVAAVYMAVFSLFRPSISVFFLDEGNGVPGIAAIAMFFDGLFLTFLGTLLTVSDALRVFYSNDGGHPGKEYRVFFRAGRAADVLQALQRGDARMLESIRKPAPGHGHSWQCFTVLTVTLDPKDFTRPGYLHIKNVYLGGGPLFTTRIYGIFGGVSLRHTILGREDLERLHRMIPDLFKESGMSTGATASRKEGVPIGLPSGSPSVIKNPSGSFICRVEPGEVRSFRYRGGFGLAGMYVCLSIMFLVGGIAILFDLGGAGSGKNTVTIVLLGSLAFFSAVVGLILGLGYARIGKPWLYRMVRNRPHRLFNPDASTIFVGIEDSRTYNRMKAIPDDFGLLHVSREQFFLETGTTRVYLVGSDLNLEEQRTSIESALRLSARFGDRDWAITAREITGWGALSGVTSSKRHAETLWRKIYEGMMGIRR